MRSGAASSSLRFARRNPDAVLAAVLFLGTVADKLQYLGSKDHFAAELAVAGMATLPVAWRRRLPLAALAVATVGMAAQFVIDPHGDGIFGQILADLLLIYSCAAYLDTRPALAGLALGYVGAPLAVIVLGADGTGAPDGTLLEVVLFFSIFILPWWLAGRVLRDRRARIGELERLTTELRHEREERARLAVEAERARIAREMHDILAHAMSLMTVQAGAAERLLDHDPNAVREALVSIRTSGSSALTDLRRVLGRLRSPSDVPAVDAAIAPQPGLGDLDRLAGHVRAAGLRIELERELDTAKVPPSVSLSAYRIIQEATTNVLKHAGARSVRITVAEGDGALTLSVEDDGAGADAKPGHGTQSGLIGMRERAAVHGGSLEAGCLQGGGYAVRARLPFEATNPRVASPAVRGP